MLASGKHSKTIKPRAGMPDAALIDLVQRQTFRFFWEGAHPLCGLARDRTGLDEDPADDLVCTSGSGFAVMAIIAGAARGWITRNEAASRLALMLGFLEQAPCYHGLFPHFMNGRTGAAIRFGRKDDGSDPPASFFVDLALAPGITANLNEEETMSLTTDQKFLLEEYKSLRDEIKTKLSENVLIQRQAVISTSIVYAIAATLEVQKIVPSVKPIAWIIWWIPVFITAFAYIFTLVNTYTIIFIATYIKQNIEPKFLSPPGGWEEFFGSQPRRWWLKLYPSFWIFASVITIGVAGFETYKTFCSV